MRTPANKALALTTLAGLLAGCAAPQLPPVDLAAPGWRVQEVQAVWRRKSDAPELIGELLVATHPAGIRLVQFSKQTLPLITAQASTNGWSISSPLRPGRFSGLGAPSDRVPWFQLTEAPPSNAPVSPRWTLHTDPDGTWRLANPRTGEFIEGVGP